MTLDEYNTLFHKLELNLVAFKPLMNCDDEVLKLVNYAIAQEREECAKLCEAYVAPGIGKEMADAIRTRGTT